MTFFLYIAVPLLVSAVAVAVYGLTSAPEGFEDEGGFHSLEFCRRRLVRNAGNPHARPHPLTRAGDADEDSSIPPGLPAH